jgi:hypothetical protein
MFKETYTNIFFNTVNKNQVTINNWAKAYNKLTN